MSIRGLDQGPTLHDRNFFGERGIRLSQDARSHMNQHMSLVALRLDGPRNVLHEPGHREPDGVPTESLSPELGRTPT